MSETDPRRFRYQVGDLVELTEEDEITPIGTLGTVRRVGPGTRNVRYQIEWHDDTLWWAWAGMLKLVTRPKREPVKRAPNFAPPRHALSYSICTESKTIMGVPA